MAYPTTLDNLTPTNPVASDYLGTAPHSLLHQEERIAIDAIQVLLGITGSLVNTSHDYKLSGVAAGDKAGSLTGTEILTNKRLTTPKLNENVAVTTTATELNLLHGNLGAWITWTPSWTNLTIGNAVVIAKYCLIGKFVAFTVTVTLGTTSAVGSQPIMTLPFTIVTGSVPVGQVRFYDVGTALYLGYLDANGYLIAYGTSGAYAVEALPSATIPFTWTTGDMILISGYYQAV